MADQKLNEISQVQSAELANVKTFLAVMNNGEIKQMSKEDMASVVGGLIPLADGNHNGLASNYQAVKQYSLEPDSSTELRLEKYGVYILTSETLAGVSMMFQKAYSAQNLKIISDPNNVNSNYFKIEQINDGDTVKVTNLSSSYSCTFSINIL